MDILHSQETNKTEKYTQEQRIFLLKLAQKEEQEFCFNIWNVTQHKKLINAFNETAAELELPIIFTKYSIPNKNSNNHLLYGKIFIFNNEREDTKILTKKFPFLRNVTVSLGINLPYRYLLVIVYYLWPSEMQDYIKNNLNEFPLTLNYALKNLVPKYF